LKRTPCLIPLLLAVLASHATADEIHLWEGRTISGANIQSESHMRVEYKIGRTTQAVDSRDVRSIVYGRTSKDFSEGVTALESGDMTSAASAFLFASEDENLRDGVRATALVKAGEAMLAGDAFQLADKTFSLLLSQFHNTRHLARALLGKGLSQFRRLDVDAAEATFQKMKAEVQSKNLGENWDLSADFELLWVAEFRGMAGVVEGYAALRERSLGEHQAIANNCSLRMGRVLLGKGEVEGALEFFDEIIESRLTTTDDVVAAAFNGRGRCAFWEAQGDLERSRQAKSTDGQAEGRQDALAAFRRARLDFLRVQVRYPGIRSEQPEALYWGGQSFLNVSSLDAERLGKVLLKRCRDGYPQSEWGMKAIAER
jgi:hypothetical protein